MNVTIKTKELADAIFNKRLADRENKITMDDVANKIGESKATISRIENGKQPSLITLVKICAWLGHPLNKYIKVGK